jgi:hypothetical protein
VSPTAASIIAVLVRCRGIDDVQDQIGEAGLLERGPERVDELMRKLADEADRVADEIGAATDVELACGRVEGLEQPVADDDLAAAERVQQRRLAGVRVSGERHLRKMGAIALGALRGTGLLDAFEPPSQRRDPVTREPPVGLDLRLTRAAGCEAAARHASQTLEVRPQTPHPGEVVLELRKLDLQLALGAPGMGREDVEDRCRPIDDRDTELLLQIAFLPRSQLVVADDHGGVGGLCQRLDLAELSRAEIRVRVGRVAVLDDVPDHGDPRGSEQLVQL